jgi:hypothetical protein
MNDNVYDECTPFTRDDWDKFMNTPFVQRQRLMYGEFLGPTPEQQREAEIAREYHETCDAYDTAVCSGISPRTGESMPVTPEEQGLISTHARAVRRRLMAEYHLTDAEFHRIITAYHRAKC